MTREWLVLFAFVYLDMIGQYFFGIWLVSIFFGIWLVNILRNIIGQYFFGIWLVNIYSGYYWSIFHSEPLAVGAQVVQSRMTDKSRFKSFIRCQYTFGRDFMNGSSKKMDVWLVQRLIVTKDDIFEPNWSFSCDCVQ